MVLVGPPCSCHQATIRKIRGLPPERHIPVTDIRCDRETYRQDSHDNLLALVKVRLNLHRKLLQIISSLGQRQVVLGISRIGHERDETVIRDINQRELRADNVRDIAVVRRRLEILQLLVGEDVQRREVTLGVPVLSRLGGRNVDDLARAPLDDDESVLTNVTSLHREGLGRSRVRGLEVHVMMLVVGHIGLRISARCKQAFWTHVSGAFS